MGMVIKSGAETQTVTTYMKVGDTETISWVKNIVTIIILERTRGVTEYAQNVISGSLRMKAMEGNTAEDKSSYMPAEEGNTAEDTSSYMPAEEMMTTALINIGIGHRVQDA
jgi:hypothetical protein